MAANLRTVIVDITAENVLNSNNEKYPRINDGYQALEWRLARNSITGTKVGGRYLVASADDISTKGAPRTVMLYSFDENSVTIHDIKVEDAN